MAAMGVRMPELQVNKAVAVCFLEAAKLTLEHLGARRLELAQSTVNTPRDMTRTYGNARRLRDYLQRCASAYQDMVKLDLTSEDTSLLVACCRRSVEAIDKRLVGSGLSPDETQWLMKNRKVLSDWAISMAAPPLIELPLRRLMSVPSEHVRDLTMRIERKVHGDVSTRTQYRAPQSSGGYGQSQGITSFGEKLISQGGFGEAESPAQDDATPPGGFPAGSLPPEQKEDEAGFATLLDPNQIRDPRLRSLAVIDLRSLQRCYDAADYRLSTVLLASIVESATLDHTIPRRAEFGLTGGPETWKMHEVVLQTLGEAAQPKDRALAFHLFASRNLLLPAAQMVTPAVITSQSFESLHQFARRVLHEMGFGAPQEMLPGPLHNEDLLQ